MKKFKLISLNTDILILFFLLAFKLNAQQNENVIYEAFKNYTELTREVTYGHLNKSTVITGENLGFQIYTFIKGSKKPSDQTTNVYCTLEDDKGQLVRSSMHLSKNGIANGVFEINNSFDSGNYVFKAYTNWMKNFDENNFYVQNITVINPKNQGSSQDGEINLDYDAQFLPEGGHLVSDIVNNVGVVVKNTLGYGVPDLNGSVYDTDGNELTTFKTNQFGISKFLILPKFNQSYKIVFEALNPLEYSLTSSELKGINLNLTELKNQVAIVVKTNELTFDELKNKPFKLSIQNGNTLKTSEFLFSNLPEVTTLINKSDLSAGINIFTVFNDENEPLLERLFFNYEGVDQLNSNTLSFQRKSDSLNIKINFLEDLKFITNSNLSISILPSKTASYNTHQNIFSQIYLQPYLRGFIENAHYYFINVNEKKRYEMDLLLLSQGWSSYTWHSMFNYTSTKNFDFEEGITLTVNNLNNNAEEYLIYPLKEYC